MSQCPATKKVTVNLWTDVMKPFTSSYECTLKMAPRCQELVLRPIMILYAKIEYALMTQIKLLSLWNERWCQTIKNVHRFMKLMIICYENKLSRMLSRKKMDEEKNLHTSQTLLRVKSLIERYFHTRSRLWICHKWVKAKI